MDIRIDSLLKGAKAAVGDVIVIIDVFRAFTTAAVALAGGAEKIIMVGDAEEALALREAGLGDVCMGEVHGRPVDGFDIGNSPHEASLSELAGKTILQRTSAGTQGIVATSQSGKHLYAGALVTARATANVIMREQAPRVVLVAMGDNGITRADEDELCAIYLRNLLQGREGNAEAVRDVILAGPRIASFHDPERPHLHPRDLEIALDVNRFDFAVRVSLEHGRPVGRRAEGTVHV